jgi:hypothetical protein
MSAKMKTELVPNGVTKNLLWLIGPGWPSKDYNVKLEARWVVASPDQLCGKNAAPRTLLSSLPGLLAKEKPEVVFLFGESVLSRKLTMDEALDWEDLARICLQMGALPVLCVPPEPPPDANESDLRGRMLVACRACPAIDLKQMKELPRRVPGFLKSVEKQIFGRIIEDPEEKRHHDPSKTQEE